MNGRQLEVKEGWTADGVMHGAGTCDLWEQMYGRKGRENRPGVNSWNQLLPFPLCLSLFVSHSPVTICVNGNRCQARQ